MMNAKLNILNCILSIGVVRLLSYSLLILILGKVFFRTSFQPHKWKSGLQLPCNIGEIGVYLGGGSYINPTPHLSTICINTKTKGTEK